MRKAEITLVLAAFVLGIASAGICAAKLRIGDPAPAMKVGKWVKGGPIGTIDSDKTYVVELWATWCEASSQEIPHLTQLANKYKDKVVFAGISVCERGDVDKFVSSKGSEMDYAVATDSSDKFMETNWMDAAGEDGIPVAYIISRAKVVWIGYPWDGLDAALEQVMAGKWDAAAFAKARDHRIAEDRMAAEVRKLTKAHKADEAMARLEAYLAEDPARKTDMRPKLIRVDILLASDEAAGYAYARELADGDLRNNPEELTKLVFGLIALDFKYKSPNWDVMEHMTDRLLELSKGKDVYTFYLRSVMYEDKGDITKAIEAAQAGIRVARESDKDRDWTSSLASRVEQLRARK